MRRECSLGFMMSVLCCVSLFLGLAADRTAAAPANDPNAAVRYLSAIGHFPAASEQAIRELEDAEKPADLAKIGADARKLLAEPKFASAMQLLRLGAACPSCNFTPDDRGQLDDPVPPFRRLRQLARFGRAHAWDLAARGKLDEAATMLTAVFMLGQHFEGANTLIGGMIGVGIRKLSLQALGELAASYAAAPVAARLAETIKRLPRPVADIKAPLRYERRCLEPILRDARGDPARLAKFTDLGLVAPPAEPGAGSGSAADSPAQPSPGKVCRANLRVLMGGWEMLLMDYADPLPATITADPIGALMTGEYLKKRPVCPANGEYRLDPGKGLEFTVTCSVHGDVDTPDPADEAAEDRKKAETLAYLQRIAPTPEYERLITECFKWYDELIALDLKAADFGTRYDDLFAKIEKSDNLFAKTVIPNFRKAHESAAQLEELIDGLLKK